MFSELGRHGAIYGLGAIISSLTAIVLVPLYTSVLSTADYGALGLIVLAGRFAGVLFGMGISSGLAPSFYDHATASARRTVVSTAAVVTLVSGSLLVLAGFSVSAVVSRALFHTPLFGPHLMVAVCFTALTLLNEIALVGFRLQKKPARYLAVCLLSFLIEISVVVYLVAFRDMGIWGALLGRLAAAAGIILPLAWLSRSLLGFRFSATEAGKMLRFGLPLSVAAVSGFVFAYIDRYFLNFYLDLHTVGVYTLACQFGLIINLLLIVPVRMVWTPMFLSVKDSNLFQRLCAKTLTYVFLIGGVLFLGLSLFAHDVIRQISAPGYWPAYTVVPLIALTYWIWSVRAIIEVAVTLKRRTLFITLNSTAGALLNIVLNMVLIPRFGMHGAAVATLVTFVAMIVSSYAYNRRLLPIPYEWGRLAKIALVAGTLFGAGHALSLQSAWLLTGVKVVLVAAFPLLLWLTGFFEPAELRRLRAMVPGRRSKRS